MGEGEYIFVEKIIFRKKRSGKTEKIFRKPFTSLGKVCYYLQVGVCPEPWAAACGPQNLRDHGPDGNNKQLTKRSLRCAGSWALLRSLYADKANFKRPLAQESTYYGGVT